MNGAKEGYLAIYREALRLGCRAVFGEPLKRHTTWRIGGDAELFLEPGNAAQAAHLLRLIAETSLPLVVMGQGSNLLVCDKPVEGVIMKIGPRMAHVSCRGTNIEAEAGAWVPRLAQLSRKNRLTGLEHAAGIPGTIGGLVVMNGGSRRECIGSRVRLVRALTLKGEEVAFTPKECAFSYRSSLFQNGAHVITSVTLELEWGEPAAIRREMLGLLRERRRKFPLKMPSCGSVFRNDPERYGNAGAPGKLIEAAGNKGLRIGGAQVSPQHANFIVNCGGATAADVIELVRRVHESVLATSSVSLACEVRYLDSHCGFSEIIEG